MLWKILAIIFMADYAERVIILPIFQKIFWKRHPEAATLHYEALKLTAEMALANLEDEEEESL